MEDPCKKCIVKACCKICKLTVWYKSGCNQYELYKTWETLFHYSKSKRITDLMINNNSRVKQIYNEEQNINGRSL